MSEPRPPALNERKDRVLVAVTLFDLKAFFSTKENFVGFNRASVATHGSQFTLAHSFANAVAHKPSGLHGYAKHPGKLIRAVSQRSKNREEFFNRFPF